MIYRCSESIQYAHGWLCIFRCDLLLVNFTHIKTISLEQFYNLTECKQIKKQRRNI